MESLIRSRIVLINNFIGILAVNLLESMRIILRDIPLGRFYIDNFFEYLRKIVWSCLPIATLTVSACSIVYSIHVVPEFSSRGLDAYLGGIIALSLIREGVPVMASLAVITQYCTGMTAQIGSMKITEQIDAMKVANVRPAAYLLVPMLLGGLVGFPLIIVICIFVGMLVNFLFSNLLINITPNLYFMSVTNTIELKDVFLAIVKGVVFGFFVSLVSYTCGILTVGGSKAVGSSTRLSVIINFALIIILDYIITALWL